MGEPIEPKSLDRLLIQGKIPKEFLAALEKARESHKSVQQTQVEFTGETVQPGNCKGLEQIYGLSQSKEAERRQQKTQAEILKTLQQTQEAIRPQRVGERRTVNYNEAGFHKPEPKPIDWDSAKPMGFGGSPLGDPKTVLPRTFRFTLETDQNTNFQYYVKSVDIDWMAKHIKVSVYETTAFDADEVLSAYTSSKCKHPLTLVLYDGCGTPIMAYRFHDVALHTYSTPLDYKTSDVLTSHAVLTYKTVEKLKRPAK